MRGGGEKRKNTIVNTGDFQSEIGKVFGEIRGELLAKFGRRFSSFFCWTKLRKLSSLVMGHLPSSSSPSAASKIWLHPKHWGSSGSRPKESKGPCIISETIDDRSSSGVVTVRRGHSSRRMTGHDNHSHHGRKGEEFNTRNIDILEHEPNDKKTTMTTSTMTSFIYHILACAISHGSRTTTTCLWGTNDITSSILDYLVSSLSSRNGDQQFINNKLQQREETDINNIRKNPWLNNMDLQHLHIKVQQQSSIKHNMVGDNSCNHYIHLNTDMFDLSDTESTSSELITLNEANIMSADINMLTVSQPRLPTPTPFDGMERLHHFRNGHQNCAPSWTSMDSNTSPRWT